MKPKYLLGFFIAIGAIVGVGAYYWNRATYLPTEYTTSGQAPLTATTTAQALLSRKLAEGRASDGSVKIQLSEAELTQVLASAMAQTPQAEPLVNAAKGMSTTIEGERISSGLVINLAEVPQDQLPVAAQGALNQLTQVAPMLSNRDIYIGIEGRPRIDQGQLVFDQQSSLRIGRVSVPLTEVAQGLGLSPQQLQQALTQLLKQSGIVLEQVQVVDGQLVITGSTP
ncbi:hypothetical protein [Halomicronema hongdechloris]|uniref:hypothetical protein n=1 Tax=Halomicronema hongdechloris TaxID=1209493 RepID=UPI0009BA9CCF|nr:hypothetical protein [Halomicronema hongdechloris]